jgi:hypothetical protein
LLFHQEVEGEIAHPARLLCHLQSKFEFVFLFHALSLLLARELQ